MKDDPKKIYQTDDDEKNLEDISGEKGGVGSKDEVSSDEDVYDFENETFPSDEDLDFLDDENDE